MALPIKNYLASSAVAAALAKSKVLRGLAISYRAQFAAGTVSADLVLNLLNGLRAGREVLADCATVDGLDDVAKTEFNDPTLSLTTELATILAAIDACSAWIATNFPKDANGYLLKDKIVDGAVVARTLTSLQTSGLVTELDVLIGAFS